MTRQVRAQLLQELGRDYVRTARSKGLREPGVVVRHALRNSLIPAVTVLGVQFSVLLGGAVITEQIFAWPGVGQLAVNAIVNRDYPVLQGVILTVALLVTLVNLAVDALYVVLDPASGSPEPRPGAIARSAAERAAGSPLWGWRSSGSRRSSGSSRRSSSPRIRWPWISARCSRGRAARTCWAPTSSGATCWRGWSGARGCRSASGRSPSRWRWSSASRSARCRAMRVAPSTTC